MNLNDRLGKKGLKITIPNKVEAEDSSKLSTFSCWIGDEEEGIVSSGSGGFGWSILGSCVLGAKAVIGRKLSSLLLAMGGRGLLSKMWPGKLASTENSHFFEMLKFNCHKRTTLHCQIESLTLDFLSVILNAGLTSIGKIGCWCYSVRWFFRFVIIFGRNVVFIICHFTCTATHAGLSKTEKVLRLLNARRPHHYCIPCESYFVRLKICLQPSFTSKL